MQCLPLPAKRRRASVLRLERVKDGETGPLGGGTGGRGKGGLKGLKGQGRRRTVAAAAVAAAAGWRVHPLHPSLPGECLAKVPEFRLLYRWRKGTTRAVNPLGLGLPSRNRGIPSLV